MNPLLDPAAHPVIGHRGASGLAPENTLASFDLALAQGAEALELDVRVTSDGVPVVVHDAALVRTTGASGLVGASTLAALRQLDAGARFTTDGAATFPYCGKGITIPTLVEVLARYPETPLLIEVKEVAASVPTRRVIEAAGAVDRVVVASFLAAALAPFPDPPFQVGASRRDIIRLYALSRAFPRRLRAPRCYAVPVRYRDTVPVPTRRFVAAAARLGRPVHVWTVNDVATAHRLWDAGCAGMITNFPAEILAARNDRFGLPRPLNS